MWKNLLESVSICSFSKIAMEKKKDVLLKKIKIAANFSSVQEKLFFNFKCIFLREQIFLQCEGIIICSYNNRRAEKKKNIMHDQICLSFFLLILTSTSFFSSKYRRISTCIYVHLLLLSFGALVELGPLVLNDNSLKYDGGFPAPQYNEYGMKFRDERLFFHG